MGSIISPDLEAFILPHEQIGLFRKASPDTTVAPSGRDFIGAIAVFLAAKGQPEHEQALTTWAVKPSFQDSSPHDADMLLAEHERMLAKRSPGLPDHHPNRHARGLFMETVLQAASRRNSLHGSHHLLGLMAVYETDTEQPNAEVWVPRTFQLEVSATAHRVDAEAKIKWSQQLSSDEKAVWDYVHPQARDIRPLVDTTVSDIFFNGLPSTADLRRAISGQACDQAMAEVPIEWAQQHAAGV